MRKSSTTPKGRRHGRIRLLLGGALTAAMVVASVAVAGPAAAISTNQTGTHDGYFYSFWTDAQGRSR